MGFSDTEAANFAGIAPSTLYNYQHKYPEFLEEKQAWKLHPNMKARITLYENLSDPRWVAWYLERRDPEFIQKRSQ